MPRYETDEQRRILDGLRAGRRIRPIVRNRGTARSVALGFSETEPLHKHALDALISRRRLILRDGEFEPS